MVLNLKFQYFGHLMQRANSEKDPDAGEDWRQEKGTTQGEMVGWHHQLNEYDFEQTPGEKDRVTWYAAIHEVAKSPTRLSD